MPDALLQHASSRTAYILLFASTLSWADNFVSNGIYYNSTDGTSVSVTSGAYKYSGDIVIPSTVVYRNKTYSVTSIGNNAFRGCSALTSIDIPECVTNIGNYAFANCQILTSIDIPSGVTSIGLRAFEGCSALTSIDIPKGVTIIKDYTFEGCSSLTSVVCRAKTVPSCRYSIFDHWYLSEATLYVLAAAIEDYKAADQWKDFGTILPIEGTGIDSPTAEQGKDTNAACYTLDGKQTITPVHGRIYIRNGKKVLY